MTIMIFIAVLISNYEVVLYKEKNKIILYKEKIKLYLSYYAGFNIIKR